MSLSRTNNIAAGAQRGHDPGPGTAAPRNPPSRSGALTEDEALALAQRWSEMGATADDLANAPLLERLLLASLTHMGDVSDSGWEAVVRLLRAEASGPPCQEAV